MAAMMVDFGEHQGYRGAFTRHQAAGALANGTRVEKTMSEDEDAHQDGEHATVLGSISHPDILRGSILYFVAWDSHPNVAVATVDWKLTPIEADK